MNLFALGAGSFAMNDPHGENAVLAAGGEVFRNQASDVGGPELVQVERAVDGNLDRVGEVVLFRKIDCGHGGFELLEALAILACFDLRSRSGDQAWTGGRIAAVWSWVAGSVAGQR